MKAKLFEQANVELAADQPQYETLPVCRVGDEEGTVICCFELDEAERKRVLETGEIWYMQLTFGRQFQPMNLLVENPFEMGEREEERRQGAGGRGQGAEGGES